MNELVKKIIGDASRRIKEAEKGDLSCAETVN